MSSTNPNDMAPDEILLILWGLVALCFIVFFIWLFSMALCPDQLAEILVGHYTTNRTFVKISRRRHRHRRSKTGDLIDDDDELDDDDDGELEQERPTEEFILETGDLLTGQIHNNNNENPSFSNHQHHQRHQRHQPITLPMSSQSDGGTPYSVVVNDGGRGDQNSVETLADLSAANSFQISLQRMPIIRETDEPPPPSSPIKKISFGRGV